jgi:Domain of unknown function (DUF4192)
MTNNKPAGDSSPRSYITTPATRPAGMASTVQLRATTPDAVLAVVPHMLGFYPGKSLVVLGLGAQNRVMVTFRYDLPEPPDEQLAEDIAEHAGYVLDRERISSALLVGYGREELVAPVIGSAAARLIENGIDLHEVLRADSGRYWSMLCDDARCCPPEGRSYDPGSHPAAAAMAEAGLAAHPDRAALARTLQRPAGSADLISRATGQALLRLSDLVDRGESDGDRDPQLRATRIGRREVQRAIRRYRSGGSIDSIEHLAWLAVLLSDIRVRDDAWARMHPAHRDHHCRLWTDVLRSAALDYAPAPASLLAFTAWQTGNGALAAMAIDRALSADPTYSMAQLLAGALEAALPPSAARMPMTPAAVAASYATEPGGAARGGAARGGAARGGAASRAAARGMPPRSGRAPRPKEAGSGRKRSRAGEEMADGGRAGSGGRPGRPASDQAGQARPRAATARRSRARRRAGT